MCGDSSRMGWNVAMVISEIMLWEVRTGLITARREGLGASCLERERGVTPQGAVTFTHSCQCQESSQSEAWIIKTDQSESFKLKTDQWKESQTLTRAHNDWAVHKNISPMKSIDSPRLFGMMTKLFLPPAFLLAPLCSWVITLPIKIIILRAPKCPFTKIGVKVRISQIAQNVVIKRIYCFQT